MKYTERTKYPELFECYWGNFDDENSELSQEIIDNRNSFAETFNIKHLSKTYLEYEIKQVHKFFDHVEFYYLYDGKLVMIVSPYGDRHYNNQFCIDFEFAEFPPMYSLQASTYIRVFEDHYEYRKWQKRILGEIRNVA